MIINGRSRRCVWWWSKHLQDENENESVRVVKIEGLASENIHDLLCEIEAQGLGTRCKNPLWIAAINPGPKEYFSEQDRDRAREILEQERGYQGQPYFMVEHEKKGWKHWHVIYSRIDAEHMRALPDGLDAKVCHAAARRIENELGLQKVIGPFDREPGMPRPPRAPEPWEMYRGMQTRLDPREITAEVTALFRQSETGKAFRAALESQGYQLATGKRGLLILDSAGKEHSLARRIDGIDTKELNAFMRDVDRQTLPTVEQAKERFQERKIAGLEADRDTVRHEIEWEEKLARAAIAKEEKERQFIEPEDKTKSRDQERGAGAGSRKKESHEEWERKAEARRQATNEKHWPVNPPTHDGWPSFEKAAEHATIDRRAENLRGAPKHLWDAWLQSDSAKAFAAALDDKGIMFAKVTKDEAERFHREAEFAKAIGRYAPRFKEDEVIVVTEPRREYHRNGEYVSPSRFQKIDPALAWKFMKGLGGLVTVQGVDATVQVSDKRAMQRAADREAARMERSTDTRDYSRPYRHQAIKGKVEVAKSAARTIGKAFDAFSDAFDSLIAPKLTPEQIREGRRAAARREHQAEDAIDFQQYTADSAGRQRRQEDELEAARQRERERGGRDR